MTLALTNDKVKRWLFFGLIVALTLISVACGETTAAGGKAAEWKAETKPLVEGDIKVEAGKSLEFPFIVTDDMRNVQVVGSFEARGGSGNDVKVAIANRDEYQNWVNEHSAKTLYETGQTTTGQISTKSIFSSIGPGEYTLGFSNRFSVLSDKTVHASVALQYEGVNK